MHSENGTMINSTAAHASLALVKAALISGERAQTVAEMLACIANQFDAFGCALWEEAPGADLNASPPKGNLFLLAAWFAGGEIFIKHDLPLAGSLTGEVVLTQKCQNALRIREEGGSGRAHAFY